MRQRFPRWSWRAALAWTLLAMLLAVAPLRATMVVTQMMDCPLCGQPYGYHAVASYTFYGKDDPGPPPPSGICPRCLYPWAGEKPSGPLNKEQVARVRAAIASWPESLPPVVRAKMRSGLNDWYGYSEQARRFGPGLVARCEAACDGKELPPYRVPKMTPSWPESDAAKMKQLRAFDDVFPSLLEAQRQGKPAFLPEEKITYMDPKVHAEYETLCGVANRLEKGDAPALEYFLHWAIRVDDKILSEHLYFPFEQGLAAIAKYPALAWPTDLDLAKVRSAFAADCLRYIRDPALPLPESMYRQVDAKNTRYLDEVVRYACAARHDRALIKPLAKRLGTGKEYLGLSIENYYQVVGSPQDVPVLAKYVRALVAAYEKPRDDMSGGIEIPNYEDAIRCIQFKTLLDGGKLSEF